MKALTKVTANLLRPLPLNRSDRLHVKLNKEGTNFVVDIYGQLSHSKTYASSVARKTFVERIPERKHIDSLGVDGWEFAATDYTSTVISCCWPKDQVIFEDDARVVHDYLILSTTMQEQTANLYAQLMEGMMAEQRVRDAGFDRNQIFMATAFAPPLVPHGTVAEHSDPDKRLSMYQRVATVNALRSEGYDLFMEQGTGKTPVSVSVMNTECEKVRKEENRPYRVLVVCPKNVRRNWTGEIEKFSTKRFITSTLRGDGLTRVKQFIDAFADPTVDFCAVICSYETMVKSFNMIEKIEWDLVILDEGHYIKWPETQRSQYAMKLRDCSRRRMLLTGTPITNTPLDLYSQLEFQGAGASGFRSWKNFRTFYGVYDEGNGEDGHKRLVGMQNLPLMQERLARRSFIVTKKQALPYLPEKVYDIIEVEMGTEQAQVYRDVATKLMYEIESELENSNNKAMVINNALTKLLRLAQITSGFVTWDPIYDDEGGVVQPKTVDWLPGSAKADALMEEIKQMGPDSKMIVWACWIPDIKALHERFEKEGIKHVLYYGSTSDKDRAIAEDSFNADPTVKVFLGNPAAGGVGLNLIGYPPGRGAEYTTNADHIVYYSQGWSPTARWQSEDRGNRRGTRVPTRISDLVVAGTIDEEIRARVVEKKMIADSVADIRLILSNVLKGIEA